MISLATKSVTNAQKVAQDVVVELQYTPKPPAGAKKKEKPTTKSVYVGWTGLQSQRRIVPVLGGGRTPTKERAIDSVEVDSIFASTLGLSDRMPVC